MKSKKTLFSGVVLIVAVWVGWWLLHLKEEEASGMDFDQNLQTVEFCGVTYQTEPVFLFDINMMDRIAEIATQRPETLVCKNIQSNPNYPRTPLFIEFSHIPDDASGIFDYLRIHSLQFSFDPRTEEIFIHSGFDGTPSFFGSFR